MRRLLEVFLKSNSIKGKVRSELSEDTTGKPIEVSEEKKRSKSKDATASCCKPLVQIETNTEEFLRVQSLN